ncbi:hypothetical protein FNN75_12720 [Salmonella enterica subsp. arizonae]|nr:hypothetical protein [Salmonella enterica]ECJ2545664.1 hypothetical protein [Salmonella enterica subsp. arizonae]SUG74918.1 Uncharacterised protein [Salmonella enterica]
MPLGFVVANGMLTMNVMEAPGISLFFTPASVLCLKEHLMRGVARKECCFTQYISGLSELWMLSKAVVGFSPWYAAQTSASSVKGDFFAYKVFSYKHKWE